MATSADRNIAEDQAAGVPPDGLVVVVKRDCPTCELIPPVLADIEARGSLTVFTQDDPPFPESIPATVPATALAFSCHRDI